MSLKEKLENIPYGLYNGLSVVSSVISIISAVIACWKAVLTVKEIDGQYIVDFNAMLGWGCALAVCFCCVLLAKIFKYMRIVQRQREAFACNYYHAIHDLRNTYFDILKEHKHAKGVDAQTKIERLTKDTKVFLEKLLDYLCDILETTTGKEIHGCIKLIENTQDKDRYINLVTATVTTFCRSKKSQFQRMSNDQNNKEPQKISRNTDFYDILDANNPDTDSWFYQSNLLEYAKRLRKSGKHYSNTTAGWEEFYRSAIVVPIRVANEHLFFNSLNSGYNVVGFLCVDSMSTEAFRDTEFDKKIYLHIVKSFAAESYIILSKYSYYLKTLKGEMKND